MGKPTSQHTGEVYKPYTREGVRLYPLVSEYSRQVKLSVIRGRFDSLPVVQYRYSNQG